MAEGRERKSDVRGRKSEGGDGGQRWRSEVGGRKRGSRLYPTNSKSETRNPKLRNSSLVTCHSSLVTCYLSLVTRHASRVTRHSSRLFNNLNPFAITTSAAPSSALIAIHSVANPGIARARKTTLIPIERIIFCLMIWTVLLLSRFK
jgi:hypothetical protein